MNGKEALTKLFFDNKDIKVDIVLNDRKVCEIYNAIKFDLDQLEKLEEVIKGLKECLDLEIDEQTETIYCCLGDVTGIDSEFLVLAKEVLGNA